MASLGGQKAVLFGGYDGSADDQTWIYDHAVSTWAYTPATGPAGRVDHAMAYIEDDKVLLFGGSITGLSDETWVYDHQASPPSTAMDSEVSSQRPVGPPGPRHGLHRRRPGAAVRGQYGRRP